MIYSTMRIITWVGGCSGKLMFIQYWFCTKHWIGSYMYDSERSNITFLSEFVVLEEMVLNKYTIIYISTYSDKNGLCGWYNQGACDTQEILWGVGGTFGRKEGFLFKYCDHDHHSYTEKKTSVIQWKKLWSG